VKDEPRVARALELTRAIGQGLHQSGDDLWLQCDVTLPQLRCLFVVTLRGPLSISGVAQQLRIGLPTASALIDRLVERGLVRRREDPQDRRRTLASATEAGATLAENLRQGSIQTLREWLLALGPEDLAALVQGLEAVVAVGGLTGCPALRPNEGGFAGTPALKGVSDVLVEVD
jgi:DNA-binding MarR family transcriptional regulator